MNAGLWTLIAAACIATFAYPEDPRALGVWTRLWLSSLPWLLACSGLATFSHAAYLDADSELLRALLYMSMVLTVGFLNPFGWAVFSRLLGLGGAACS